MNAMQLKKYFHFPSHLVEKQFILILLVLTIPFFSNNLKAQTTLYPGDIAFTGVNMDATKGFSFVILVDIDSGTTINFTDNGWLASGALRGGEGTLTWTAPRAYTAGEQVSTTTLGTMNFSTSGDQILAYQGLSTNPSFIAAINVDGSAVWQTDATNSNTSALPDGLTNGVNCIALNEDDNLQYDESTYGTSGTKTEILILINTASHWLGNTTSTYTLSTTTYTVSFESEPSNHAESFIATVDSHKDITNTWTENDGTVHADGFLILINRNGTFTYPEDGTLVSDDTDLSDGEGAINIAHGIQTYTWTDLDSEQDYYFIIFPYAGSGGTIDFKIDDPVPVASGTTLALPDEDSTIEAPASQIASTPIPSLANASGDAVDVFSFKITDSGTLDGLPTYVTNVNLKVNSSNTIDWTDHIQGVVLNDGSSDITVDHVTITDASIDLAILKGDLVIADGTSTTLTVSIYLNTSKIVDNGIFSCYIDQNAHGFTADEYGSTFTIDPLLADIVSADHTIDVDATKLMYQTVPDYVNVGVDFSAEVWAVDANNNLDLDETSSITLSDDGVTGTLSSATSLTAELTYGSFIWSDLGYDAVESFNLIATDDAANLTTVSSPVSAYAAGIATPGSIIISEIMYNPSGTEPDWEWFELFNNNSFSVDIENWTITDAGTNSITIGVSTTVEANSFFTFGKNGTPGTNGNYLPDFDYSTSTFLLANGVDEIIINSTSTEITRVEYDESNGWPAAVNNSIIFTGTASDDNNMASNWVNSGYHENGYLGTTNTDKGSPGTNGYNQNLTTASTWSGTGNWSEGNLATATNWSNGFPGTVTNVTVDGILTVDMDTLAVANDLSISTGNSMAISPLKNLTIYGNLTTDDALTLEANSTGTASLITYGSITGTADVQSYYADLSSWYLNSCPISNGRGIQFIDDLVYLWDEPANSWDNRTTDFALTPGIGYAIYKNVEQTETFSGTLNTGDVSNNLDYNYNFAHLTPHDGWNLMGNPYPSVLDISYLDYTNISNGVWVNLHSVTTSAADYYVYWSKTLGTVGSSGEGGGDLRARYIQPGQGFWIYTDTDGQPFKVTNAMRTHVRQGSFSKSSHSSVVEHSEILKISVSGGDIVDPMYLVFRDDATPDFDRAYDLYKMTSSSPSVPHIYSLTGEETPQKLAINAIAAPQSETSIPLGLKIGTNGTYRLYFDGLNSFDETQDFYIRDNLSGELTDIRQESMLEFNHLTTNAENRFDLVMGLRTAINNPLGISSLATIYSSRNSIYIRPGENHTIQHVEIRNIIGQVVLSENWDNTYLGGKQVRLPNAFYIVEIQTEEGKLTKKIFIQN